VPKRTALDKSVFYLVTFVSGAIISAITEDAIKERVLHSEMAALLILTVLLVGLSFTVRSVLHTLEARTHLLESALGNRTAQILNSIEALDDQIGIKVKYVEREKGQAILFKELRSVIEQANQNIIAVNTFLSERNLPESDPDEDSDSARERRLYYDSIIQRVSDSGVVYQRVIQVENEETFAEMVGDYEYSRHFHLMLDLKDVKPAQVA